MNCSVGQTDAPPAFHTSCILTLAALLHGCRKRALLACAALTYILHLFSTEEKMFWSHQIGYVVASQAAHLGVLGGTGPQQPANVTYEVSGTNARINFGSSDHSINEVNVQTPEVFDHLRGVLADVDDDQQREALSRSIDEMESAHGSPDFLTRYQNFVALAADHTTIFAPFLPVLANLLN
jgi:hypothetical protein